MYDLFSKSRKDGLMSLEAAKVSNGLPGFVSGSIGNCYYHGIIDGPQEEIHVGAADGHVLRETAGLAHEEAKFFKCTEVCLLATLNGYAPPNSWGVR